MEVLKHLDLISGAAQLMGAVNTVVNQDGRLFGENTDGKGFMRALVADARVDPGGKQVVILGAGGAARAISVELALAGAAHITIVNRSSQRGRELVNLLIEDTPASADFISWEQTFSIPSGTDVLVNATSIGLYPDVDAKPDIDYHTITRSMTVCDVIPNPPNTPFLREAQVRDARTLDGLGMLVYQGAIGFKLWTGLEAPIKEMREALEKALG